MKHKIVQIDFGSYEKKIGRRKQLKYFVGVTRDMGKYVFTRIYNSNKTSATRLISILLDNMAAKETNTQKFRNGWRWYLLFILLLLLAVQSNIGEVCYK